MNIGAALYPVIGEKVYWQRDVEKVYIFSEKTGESQSGNLTAGRIIELSDGTRSLGEIGHILSEEFGETPSEKEVIILVSDFLSECEKKGFIELRSEPDPRIHRRHKETTRASVEQLIEKNATVFVDEKASFDTNEKGEVTTYSVKKGKYLLLTPEEKDILMYLLEEKPLQNIVHYISEKHRGREKQMVVEFISELIDYGLVKLRD